MKRSRHQARWAVLRHDGFRCQACGKAGRLECDHVKPIDAGGESGEA